MTILNLYAQFKYSTKYDNMPPNLQFLTVLNDTDNIKFTNMPYCIDTINYTGTYNSIITIKTSYLIRKLIIHGDHIIGLNYLSAHIALHRRVSNRQKIVYNYLSPLLQKLGILTISEDYLPYDVGNIDIISHSNYWSSFNLSYIDNVPISLREFNIWCYGLLGRRDAYVHSYTLLRNSEMCKNITFCGGGYPIY
jgi:hypothetical protein